MTITRVLLALALAAVIGIGNYGALQALAPSNPNPTWELWLVASPVVLGLLLATLLPGSARTTSPEAVVARPAAPPPPPPPPPTDAALRLLGLMQEEGRLVDFIQEDLAPYPDDQIGAAVRGIQEGCRKALRERIAFAPILPGKEGEPVTVEPGFDPAAIRLTGKVGGQPPFHGVLRHPGWRANDARIPERPGQDPRVIAPAEVEIT
jgi:hypothetical protein